MKQDEKQSFEIIGTAFNSKVTSQYSVIAENVSEAKRVFYKTKPNFDIKIIYPSRFDECRQYSE